MYCVVYVVNGVGKSPYDEDVLKSTLSHSLPDRSRCSCVPLSSAHPSILTTSNLVEGLLSLDSARARANDGTNSSNLAPAILRGDSARAPADSVFDNSLIGWDVKY